MKQKTIIRRGETIMRKRSKSIHIRLSEEEYLNFKYLLKESGLSQTDFFVMAIHGTPIRPACEKKSLEELKTAIWGAYTQIRRIGNNINQLAFIANQTHNFVATENIQAIRSVISEQSEGWKKIWQYTKSLTAEGHKRTVQ